MTDLLFQGALSNVCVFLLNAIEHLASPVIRRPMMASEITSG